VPPAPSDLGSFLTPHGQEVMLLHTTVNHARSRLSASAAGGGWR
jgi:hypothetical protein